MILTDSVCERCLGPLKTAIFSFYLPWREDAVVSGGETSEFSNSPILWECIGASNKLARVPRFRTTPTSTQLLVLALVVGQYYTILGFYVQTLPLDFGFTQYNNNIITVAVCVCRH